MALYSIDCEQVLGMSHTGEVTTEGASTVELSDEEVDTLVRLIREEGTTDVEELELEERYPDIYEKLDEAYRTMARDAELSHWVWEGYRSHYYEYDEEELMEYCEENLGFKFEYDEKDYYYDDPEDLPEGEEPEIDEDSLMWDKERAFDNWLDDYLESLPDNEAVNFMGEHMNADVCVDNVDYTVEIPQAIIDKAKKED